MIYLVYADGACRGNPGPMAIGASIQNTKRKELATVSALIGHGTNNVAEYRVGIEGLKKARDLGATEVELRMDSELVVEQIKGHFKVNHDALQVLHAEILDVLRGFAWHAVAYVPRAKNRRADKLANAAYAPRSHASSEETVVTTSSRRSLPQPGDKCSAV